MIRVGGVHAINVDDYDSEEQYVNVRYRPDAGTPIKNTGDSERLERKGFAAAPATAPHIMFTPPSAGKGSPL